MKRHLAAPVLVLHGSNQVRLSDEYGDKFCLYNSTVDDAASARVDHNEWIEWLATKDMDHEQAVQKMLMIKSHEFIAFAPFLDIRDLWYNKFGKDLFPGMSTVDDLDDFMPGVVSLGMVKEYYNKLNSGFVYHLYINMNQLDNKADKESLWPTLQKVSIPSAVSFPNFQVLRLNALTGTQVEVEEDEGDEDSFGDEFGNGEDMENDEEEQDDEDEEDDDEMEAGQREKPKARKLWEPESKLNQKGICVHLKKIYDEIKEDGGDFEEQLKKWKNYDTYVKSGIKSAIALNSCSTAAFKWCKKILVIFVYHKLFTVSHLRAYGLGKAWDVKLDADSDKVLAALTSTTLLFPTHFCSLTRSHPIVQVPDKPSRSNKAALLEAAHNVTKALSRGGRPNSKARCPRTTLLFPTHFCSLHTTLVPDTCSP